MTIVPVLPIGTNVKVTKVVAFADSKVKVGSIMQGKLTTKTTANECIRFQNGTNTGPVKSMNKTVGGDYIVSTETSIYFMQVLQ
ncbi:MAG: hypothetical protein KBB91_00280 [Candidatus Pacebacteria bacterium]|jgi:hypothetical protein|nr:hypothetical protein [Candidatus Paceibacterota bacterium]